MKKIVSLFILIILCSHGATLMWDRNPPITSDYLGYRVYWGTDSHSYIKSIDVKTNNQWLITDVPVGTIYFSVTAVYSNLWMNGDYWVDYYETDFADEIFWLNTNQLPSKVMGLQIIKVEKIN